MLYFETELFFNNLEQKMKNRFLKIWFHGIAVTKTTIFIISYLCLASFVGLRFGSTIMKSGVSWNEWFFLAGLMTIVIIGPWAINELRKEWAQKAVKAIENHK